MSLQRFFWEFPSVDARTIWSSHSFDHCKSDTFIFLGQLLLAYPTYNLSYRLYTHQILTKYQILNKVNNSQNRPTTILQLLETQLQNFTGKVGTSKPWFFCSYISAPLLGTVLVPLPDHFQDCFFEKCFEAFLNLGHLFSILEVHEVNIFRSGTIQFFC